MLQRARRLWKRAFPPTPALTESQRHEVERSLVQFYEGEDRLAEFDAKEAAQRDPTNPLNPVHDLWTARHFVLSAYPGHTRLEDVLLARVFSLVVLHVVALERDPHTHLAPQPSRLDELLAMHTGPELAAMLRASPIPMVRKSTRRWGQPGGPHELDVQSWFQEIKRRYSGRWHGPNESDALAPPSPSALAQ